MHTESDFSNEREHIEETLRHLDHILPGQAPILDFVHHNTLHGYEHLQFEAAIAEYEKISGIRGYLPEERSRDFYLQGRITDEDIDAELYANAGLRADEIIFEQSTLIIRRRDIYRIALLSDLQPLTVSQLNWKIEEEAALQHVQGDVPPDIRTRMLAQGPDEETIVCQLWDSVLAKLNLKSIELHPENMLDLSIDEAKEWLGKISPDRPGDPETAVHQRMRQEAKLKLESLLAQVGNEISLRGLVKALSGVDTLFSVRLQLTRICASALDEGVAAWQLPERDKLGLYGAWRATSAYDLNSFMQELPDWQAIMAEIPEDAVDCIIMQLKSFGIPVEKWAGYLQRLALEIPGWSGMINWRQHNPDYQAENNASPNLADYLAIRLTLDRLWLKQACNELWGIEAKLVTIQYYFERNLSEFMIRRLFFQGELPEYLTHPVKALLSNILSERHRQSEWQHMADLMWTWQYSPLSANAVDTHQIFNNGWRMFRLCQHLGLNAEQVRQIPQPVFLGMLEQIDTFDIIERSKIWLYAYERHYREGIFHAVRANHQRGCWEKRDKRPEAQLIFCIDDREESFRRHLEETNPNIETLGAGGFFGVPIYYKAMDETQAVSLCPLVVTPTHIVEEVPRTGYEAVTQKHNQGMKLINTVNNWLHQRLRHNLLTAKIIVDAIAPAVLTGLLLKTFTPKLQYQLINNLKTATSPEVHTQLNYIDNNRTLPATPENLGKGFTDAEQAEKVAAFLTATGLTFGFAELILLVGHGSISQNNPHLAAYDCGACSGRHGGPNARLFAAMANRPEIRRLVAEKGIVIPDDSWFVGTEHNTCNEEISYYDLEDVPSARLPALDKLRETLRHVQHLSAHERCRRLASAPRNPTLQQALKHIEERARDFSQARPELGHVTVASAVFGRRSVTQGIFLDRRMFLVSYDPTQDPDGVIIEKLLLAMGPVGAGINLEYYFSTVDNEGFGCSTKILHNVVGSFAVIEGTRGDLRTGLPKQMIEIHEAMRLLVIVEATTEIIGNIYARQPAIQNLVGNGWIQVAVKDPDSDRIDFFERDKGFVQWQPGQMELPVFEKSPDCYYDKTEPVSPALINQPQSQEI